MHELRAIERTLLPPLEHNDVPIHGCYTSIVWLNLVNDAFHTDKGCCHPWQNLNAVSDFKFVHIRSFFLSGRFKLAIESDEYPAGAEVHFVFVEHRQAVLIWDHCGYRPDADGIGFVDYLAAYTIPEFETCHTLIVRS